MKELEKRLISRKTELERLRAAMPLLKEAQLQALTWQKAIGGGESVKGSERATISFMADQMDSMADKMARIRQFILETENEEMRFLMGDLLGEVRGCQRVLAEVLDEEKAH